MKINKGKKKTRTKMKTTKKRTNILNYKIICKKTKY